MCIRDRLGVVLNLQAGALPYDTVKQALVKDQLGPAGAAAQVDAAHPHLLDRLTLSQTFQHRFDLAHFVDAAGAAQRRQHPGEQPVAAFQRGDPAGQVQGHLPHGELVQQTGNDVPDVLLGDVDAVHRQHGDGILLPQPGSQLPGLGALWLHAVEELSLIHI